MRCLKMGKATVEFINMTLKKPINFLKNVELKEIQKP